MVCLPLECWIWENYKQWIYKGSSSLSLSASTSPSGTEWREERGTVEEEGEGSCSWEVLMVLLLLLPVAISHSLSAVWIQLSADSSLVSLFTPSPHSSLSRVGEDVTEGEWESFLALRLASLKLARGGRSRTPLRVEPSIAFWSWEWKRETSRINYSNTPAYDRIYAKIHVDRQYLPLLVRPPQPVYQY